MKASKIHNFTIVWIALIFIFYFHPAVVPQTLSCWFKVGQSKSNCSTDKIWLNWKTKSGCRLYIVVYKESATGLNWLPDCQKEKLVGLKNTQKLHFIQDTIQMIQAVWWNNKSNLSCCRKSSPLVSTRLSKHWKASFLALLDMSPLNVNHVSLAHI